MRPRKPPARVWVVIDPMADGREIVFFGLHAKKREAVEECQRLNDIPGYEPSCIVVRYDRRRERARRDA